MRKHHDVKNLKNKSSALGIQLSARTHLQGEVLSLTYRATSYPMGLLKEGGGPNQSLGCNTLQFLR